MIYSTDTRLIQYASSYKKLTDDIHKTLIKTIPKFNERSKVAFIHEIVFDKDKDMLHIKFEYFGEAEPTGKALVRLVFLSGLPIRFFHDYYRIRENDNKYKRTVLKDWRDKYQREYSKEYNQRDYVKEADHKRKSELRKTDKYKEQNRNYKRQRYHTDESYRQHILELRKEYRKTLPKEKSKQYRDTFYSKPENKYKQKYYRYKKTHGLKDLTYEEFCKTIIGVNL